MQKTVSYRTKMVNVHKYQWLDSSSITILPERLQRESASLRTPTIKPILKTRNIKQNYSEKTQYVRVFLQSPHQLQAHNKIPSFRKENGNHQLPRSNSG
eukprot:c20979_g1_i1 orf=349-645(-)